MIEMPPSGTNNEAVELKTKCPQTVSSSSASNQVLEVVGRRDRMLKEDNNDQIIRLD